MRKPKFKPVANQASSSRRVVSEEVSEVPAVPAVPAVPLVSTSGVVESAKKKGEPPRVKSEPRGPRGPKGPQGPQGPRTSRPRSLVSGEVAVWIML